MELDYRENGIRLTGAKWARRSEACAALVFEHLSPDTVWLDAGCGRRLLGQDLDLSEDWLAAHWALIVGIDMP